MLNKLRVRKKMSSNISLTVISENKIDVTAALFDLSEIKLNYTDYQFDVVAVNIISPTIIIYGVEYIQKLFTVGEDGMLTRNENRKRKHFTVITNSLDRSIEIEDFNNVPLKDGLHSLYIVGTAYINNEDDVTTNDILFKFIDKITTRSSNISIVLRNDILNESKIVYNKDYLLTNLQKVTEE